jgi:hypothetical protein
MNQIAIRILNDLLSRSCPARIPRSGDKGKEVSCYSISLQEGDSPKLLVETLSSNGFTGRHFEGGGFRPAASVPFTLSRELIIRIEHYHGLVTHTYLGLFDYVIHEWTRFYKLKSLYILARQRVPQFFFNRRKLQLATRMAILEKVVAKQSDEPRKSFSSHDIMSYMYSLRWYLHPQRTQLRQRMDLYLESFVDSGELKRVSGTGELLITGKAVATLESYQIEVSREREMQDIFRRV